MKKEFCWPYHRNTFHCILHLLIRRVFSTLCISFVFYNSNHWIWRCWRQTWGWLCPIRTKSDCMSSLTAWLLECIRAMIWGKTTSHVSILTSWNPFWRAIWTSAVDPWLNHRVRRRRISWRIKEDAQISTYKHPHNFKQGQIIFWIMGSEMSCHTQRSTSNNNNNKNDN